MIPVNEPLLDGNEEKYLVECVRSGWISSEGPFVARFETQFAAAMGRRFGIAVCNGSVALEAAIAALGIGPGDEVIMPAFTIVSCAAAIVRQGAAPVLVDADPATWNMDVGQVEEKISSRTRAIMVVHIYGLPTDMDRIIDLANKHGLKIIEDAAEAHGQSFRQHACGSFGDISTFSFYANKLVTTGEGGMLLTDSEELAERCRSLRNLCFNPERRFVHDQLGWNMRMTSLQAAVGVAQLERLPEFVKIKRRMGRRYTQLLNGIAGIQLPIAGNDDAENIYWVYGIVLEDDISFDAREAMARLADSGVGTRAFFWPMHEQPVFRKMGLFGDDRHPVAERIARRGFYVPSGLGITDAQIDYVAATLKRILQ